MDKDSTLKPTNDTPEAKKTHSTTPKKGRSGTATDRYRKAESPADAPPPPPPPESPPPSLLDRLLAARDRVHAFANSGIMPPVPIWLSIHDGAGVIESGITVIQGKSGMGKSSWAETFCAALLSDGPEGILPGLERVSERKFCALYLDTERGDVQRIRALQRMRTAGGRAATEERSDLFVVPFEVSKEDALQAFEALITDTRRRMDETGKANFGLFVCLDVITDIMKDALLDFSQVLAFMEVANNLKKLPQTAFCFIIHENNAGDKARGHIGTEITNKADQIYQALKNGNVFELRNIKNREAQPRAPLKAMKGNETQCFLPLSGEGKSRAEADKERATDILLALFTRAKAHPQKHVWDEMKRGASLSAPKATELLNELTGPQAVHFVNGHPCTIEERGESGEPWTNGKTKYLFRVDAPGRTPEPSDPPF